MNVYNWRAIVFLAFFFSITVILLVGTMIEQFRLKHWSVSYLTIVFIVSSFVSFFLLQVSILDSYPFGWVFVVGWTVSTLPFVVNISYNLFKVSRGQQLKNP